MSTSQRKNTLISVDPRAVTERIVVIPGTMRMVSSMGRVTRSIWISTGVMPLSTRMTIRGKSVCGENRDGQAEDERHPGECKRQDDDDHRPSVRLDELGEAAGHGFFSSCTRI